MTMVTIGQSLVAREVFTVTRDRQQEVIDELIEAGESVMREQPGYISANIYRGLDGTKVVNYTQWRQVEDFQVMLCDPTATEHRQRAERIAISVEPHLCEVAFMDHAAASAAP